MLAVQFANDPWIPVIRKFIELFADINFFHSKVSRSLCFNSKYMEKRIQIGLVGDFSEKIHTLVALNNAIEHCKPKLHFKLEAIWVPTTSITPDFLVQHNFEGFYIVPGSPYKNDHGVYELIKWSRENNF